MSFSCSKQLHFTLLLFYYHLLTIYLNPMILYFAFFPFLFVFFRHILSVFFPYFSCIYSFFVFFIQTYFDFDFYCILLFFVFFLRHILLSIFSLLSSFIFSLSDNPLYRFRFNIFSIDSTF